MYSIIVKTKLKANTREQFLAAMLVNANASVRDEPNCFVFDVLQDQQDLDLFYLYEVYRNEAALDEHKKTTHYLACRSAVNRLIAEQSVVRAHVLASNPLRK